MNIFNLLWFIVGCASGYVVTLMIIFIMTVDRDGRLPYKPPAIQFEYTWLDGREPPQNCRCSFQPRKNGHNGEPHE